MKAIYPKKLQKGNGVRVIAPARSLGMPWITDEVKQIAQKRFEDLGLVLSFGKHVHEIDEFNSSSVVSRITDINEAFSDPNVNMIITSIGGYNSNQLLDHIDFELIKNNPKIFCGYSDITALSNSIFARTGLVTYHGPHFFSFGEKLNFEYTLDYFKKCLFDSEPFEVLPSDKWSNDRWAAAQNERTYQNNEGWWIINPGEALGTVIGGNQCTFNLLHGSKYIPSLHNSILFLEDDDEAQSIDTIDRDLQSIIHQPAFSGVKGIIFGRFQPGTNVSRKLLEKVISTKNELSRIPIIANVDFGHTTPIITFPIGGTVSLEAIQNPKITILQH